MADRRHHEALYRGAGNVERLKGVSVVLCGGGAVGSLLADNLARLGFETLAVIDHDRIEEHNVGTQLYGQSDIGVWKVDALQRQLFRSTGVEIQALRKTLDEQSAPKLLKGATVVIDAFDNRAARMAVQTSVRKAGTPCLHVGLYEDYAEVIWDERYRVPKDVGGDVCDYPLARNLVLLAVSIAAETLMTFCLEGERQDWTATLRDFAIRKIEE